ncbi:MAG TPA: hypothetical protein VFB50_00955, partial [Chloroflexota bacterium]|nr:hypothetical protein [Chloroflexota bacterium]
MCGPYFQATLPRGLRGVEVLMPSGMAITIALIALTAAGLLAVAVYALARQLAERTTELQKANEH